MNAPIEIKQRSFPRGSTSLTIHDDGTLRAVYRHWRSYYEFTAQLADLESVPGTQKAFPLSLLVAMAIFGPIAIGMLIAGILLDPNGLDRDVPFISSAFCALVAILCGFSLWYQSGRWLIFANAKNPNGSVVLFYNKPNPAQFNAFVEALKKEIAGTKALRAEQTGPALALQIRELLKLKEDGVLTEEEFLKAKGKVIETGE